MWDLPGPGLEPVSPASAGGFLTTAPPGKSNTDIFDQTSWMVKRMIKKGKLLKYLFMSNMELIFPGMPHQQNQNLDNFCVPINILLDQKCSIFSQPKCQSNSLQTRLTMWPQQSRCFLFVSSLFFILHPAFHLSFWFSKRRLSASWSVKVCLYHLNCLL